jgi:signal transduction histidine kinase
MFTKARIKLTAWYLMIIMAISLSFSVAIYTSVDRELTRMDNMRKDRQARVDAIEDILAKNGFLPPQDNAPRNQETLEQSRVRIISILGFINGAILVISGVGGYLLAGLTLDPIQKMVKEQKDFVGNASHELRTPITSLKTEIEVALRDKNMTLKGAQSLLKSNLEDINGMQKLSNYLLALSKFENADNRLQIVKMDLGKTVSDSIDGLVPVAAKKGIAIAKNISSSEIKADFAAVSQLATILIDNAVKYSGKAKRIKVTVTKGGKLIVRDFGIGISKTDIPHIFERFYRADASRSKNKTDGYGLGLSIAKTIADRLGAKIKVESTLGKGSAFSVQFPLA